MDRPIVLLQIDDKYVPIAESAVEVIATVQASVLEEDWDSPQAGDSKAKSEGIP